MDKVKIKKFEFHPPYPAPSRYYNEILQNW